MEPTPQESAPVVAKKGCGCRCHYAEGVAHFVACCDEPRMTPHEGSTPQESAPEREEYCTWLPVPDHTQTDRGFTHLNEWDIYERSHADRPVLSVNGEDMEALAAERFALAILWAVRHHYQGHGARFERDHDHD